MAEQTVQTFFLNKNYHQVKLQLIPNSPIQTITMKGNNCPYKVKKNICVKPMKICHQNLNNRTVQTMSVTHFKIISSAYLTIWQCSIIGLFTRLERLIDWLEDVADKASKDTEGSNTLQVTQVYTKCIFIPKLTSSG